MADLFIDDDSAKFARRRRCAALRDDKPVFGLVPAEEAELKRLDAEFGEDLLKEYPDDKVERMIAGGITPEPGSWDEGALLNYRKAVDGMDLDYGVPMDELRDP